MFHCRRNLKSVVCAIFCYILRVLYGSYMSPKCLLIEFPVNRTIVFVGNAMSDFNKKTFMASRMPTFILSFFICMFLLFAFSQVIYYRAEHLPALSWQKTVCYKKHKRRTMAMNDNIQQQVVDAEQEKRVGI